MRKLVVALLLILVANSVHAERNPQTISDWLCGSIFEGGGATLAMTRDGFFGLRMEIPQKPAQNVTGLWRLSPDGIELILATLQDIEIRLTVGRDGIHALLGPLGNVTLLPSRNDKAIFQATGYLEVQPGGAILTDAASGRSFPVVAKPDAQNGKFAVVEIEIGQGTAHAGNMLQHSGTVPRFYELPAAEQTVELFMRDVCDRFWLLPFLNGVEKSGIRFSPPLQKGESPNFEGRFEVVGQGLRLEGGYRIAGGKLTTYASRASVRNLELIGAEAVAAAILGEFSWRLSSRGLELLGDKMPVLLSAI